MSILFPSDEWIKAFRDALNNSPAYARVAARWEGDFLFLVERPDRPPVRLYMDLWHGQCRAAHMVPEGSPDQPAAFQLSAPLDNFVKVLRGQLDPMQAMMTGKLKVQGDMVRLMRNIPTVLEFVRTGQQVDTAWPEAQ